MSQRLSIARGLVHDPTIVVLDEPFTGLDQRAAERLAERLETLHRAGRTVVLVTHDVAIAHRLADTTIVLSGGRIVHEQRGAETDVSVLERAYLDASDPTS